MCGSNTHFHILNKFTHISIHFFIYIYIKNTKKYITQTLLPNGLRNESLPLSICELIGPSFNLTRKSNYLIGWNWNPPIQKNPSFQALIYTNNQKPLPKPSLTFSFFLSLSHFLFKNLCLSDSNPKKMPLGERSGDKESRYCGVETEFNDDMPQLLSHNLASAGFDFVVATLVRIIAHFLFQSFRFKVLCVFCVMVAN